VTVLRDYAAWSCGQGCPRPPAGRVGRAAPRPGSAASGGPCGPQARRRAHRRTRRGHEGRRL